METAKETTRPSAKERLIPGVKHVIAVASGKGGVGKSTVCANLALALTRQGAKVGLMDADVYGPSIPTILGITDKPQSSGDSQIKPVERFGVKVISMGFFVPVNEAVIWRGPMLHKMVQDFLGVVDWGELDYLLIDLPPGTGDVQLSVCQTIPLTGAVIVSTPQDVAWNVAQKAIVMFDKLNAPVLGIIENMSRYVCGHCGGKEEIFGHGGARRAAEVLGIPFLGEIPLRTRIRSAADRGESLGEVEPQGDSTADFRLAADNLAAQVVLRERSGSSKPVPKSIQPPGADGLIRIQWTDGSSTTLEPRPLRLACPCAACVDEITGRRVLDPARVREDVHATAIGQVGRYALHITWSDGHATGLYSFEKLRALGKTDGAA